VSDDIKRKVDLVDKLFGHVSPVLWFNRHGHGPFVAQVCVRANVHPSASYPNARISFGQFTAEPRDMDFGGVLLTVDQAVEIVKLLKVAIAEVTKACPSLLVPDTNVDDLS
jgi:hypothetical protein